MRKIATAGLSLERDLLARGFRCIAGIDEAGRGAWAGPVSAAAVCLPVERDDLPALLEGVNDSKTLTARTREGLIDTIQNTALAWGVGRAEAEEIDALGIVPATCLAMRRAVDALAASAPQLDLDFLLLDQIKWRGFPGRKIDYQAVIRGDSLSLSIAAASVIAKVARDRWMTEYDALYPQYGFAAHKGYGVKQHQAALREYGASPLHRRTWRPFQPPLLPIEETE